MSEADLPSLHAIFEEWRPAVEDACGTARPTTREALPVVKDLLEQLHRRIVAATHDRTAQLDQLHELLLAAFAGTLAAVDTPAPSGAAATEDRTARQITVGWAPVTPVITVSINADDRLRLRRSQRQSQSQAQSHPDQRPAELLAQAPPVLDWPALLDQLGGALEAADRVLAATRPAVSPPAAARTPWHEDRELMDLFQDLLTAGVHDDGALALRHIERLRQSLRLRHGVETVEYDDEHAPSFGYTGQPPADDPRYITVKPALVHASSGRVLARGEASGSAPARPTAGIEGPSHV